MSIFLWKLKERSATFLNSSFVFSGLLSSVLKKIISRPSVFFVEIGANDGVTGDHIFSFVKEKKLTGVYIEPQKKVFERLKKNLANIDGLAFENIAITEKEEDVTIYSPQGDDGSVLASLLQDGAQLSQYAGQLNKEVVRGYPFSYIVDKYFLKSRDCVLLIIDVEGYDETVIRSINFSEFKPHYILFEHKHMTYIRHATLNSWLNSHGYKIYTDKVDSLACLS